MRCFSSLHLTPRTAHTVLMTGILVTATQVSMALASGSSGYTDGSTASNSMPWDNLIFAIRDNLSGPILSAIGVIALVIAGLTWAFGRGEDGAKKTSTVLAGVSIAAFAAPLLTRFFGLGGSII